MGGTAASCLWLQPACHYDDSVAYQCLPWIYLACSRLWPRLEPSLAPVHPSAPKVFLWHSGHNLLLSLCLAPRRHVAMLLFVLLIQAAGQNKCLQYNTDRSVGPGSCFVMAGGITGRFYWDLSVLGLQCGWIVCLMAPVKALLLKYIL